MEKLDILMGILGFAAYLAIMLDLRNYEQKVAIFEAIQEKRRLYAQRAAEKRKEELAREKATEKKAARQIEMNQMAGMAQKLGEMQDAEVMKQSRTISGKIA